MGVGIGGCGVCEVYGFGGVVGGAECSIVVGVGELCGFVCIAVKNKICGDICICGFVVGCGVGVGVGEWGIGVGIIDDGRGVYFIFI